MPRKKRAQRPLTSFQPVIIKALDTAIHREFTLTFDSHGEAARFVNDCNLYRRRLLDEGTPLQQAKANEYYTFSILRKHGTREVTFRPKILEQPEVMAQLAEIDPAPTLPLPPLRDDILEDANPSTSTEEKPPITTLTVEDFFKDLDK